VTCYVSVRASLIHDIPSIAFMLNERALSQDDVELVFSSLVFLAGYKPDLETALARMLGADTLAARGQEDAWNNGSRMWKMQRALQIVKCRCKRWARLARCKRWARLATDQLDQPEVSKQKRTLWSRLLRQSGP
jgi:hypothetical protein